jgi:predicted transcriptional regulator
MQAGWNANYSFLFAALLLLLLTAVGGSSVKKVRKSSDQEKHEATLNQSTLSPADNPAFDLIRKLLEDDEFRIVKIILENEGVTQDSLHFRTGFSQSKISIIVKKLEEKNLIVRERFGRTYKVYPSEWFRKMLV